MIADIADPGAGKAWAKRRELVECLQDLDLFVSTGDHEDASAVLDRLSTCFGAGRPDSL